MQERRAGETRVEITYAIGLHDALDVDSIDGVGGEPGGVRHEVAKRDRATGPAVVRGEPYGRRKEAAYGVAEGEASPVAGPYQKRRGKELRDGPDLIERGRGRRDACLPIGVADPCRPHQSVAGHDAEADARDVPAPLERPPPGHHRLGIRLDWDARGPKGRVGAA